MKKLLLLVLVALGVGAIAYALSNRPVPPKETLATKPTVPTKEGSPGDPGYSPPTVPSEPTAPVMAGERT